MNLMEPRREHEFLDGGSAMGALIRSRDWRDTPLGAPAQWPQSLRTAVSICLHSRFPILVWWGPRLVMLYNDAYRPMLGMTKHPHAMGQEGKTCWPEIWHIIGPLLEGVLATGTATWSSDQLLPLDRNGFLEECYFTYSYSPIHDESGGIGGVFTAVTETTERVVNERRIESLRLLSELTADSRETGHAYASAVDVLARNPRDVPFAMLYAPGDGGALHCVGSAGAVPAQLAALQRVLPSDEHGKRLFPKGLDTQVASTLSLPAGNGGAGGTIAVQPIMSTTQDAALGFVVIGLHPQRPLDEGYRTYIAMVAGYIGRALDNARSHEVERQRAEELAALDRAKTTFFSNISHELRTPLTLMLGPLEQLLEATPAGSTRDALSMAHRNALRLRKLVNTLLDFSRIEAGRMQTRFEATDLATTTTDIAALFRSSIEAAGLRFVVDCPPLPDLVDVDRDMWEKIVVNFLSNAYKYTLEGSVTLALRSAGDHVVLSVTDTGVGIAEPDMPRLFERFHRVENQRGRTQEGTGIGLALVRELVALHQGSVAVSSVGGRGSTFSVTIPVHQPGAAQAPQPGARAASSTSADELQRLAATVAAPVSLPPADLGEAVHARGLPRVLVADDNADLRAYLGRLLVDRFDVVFAADGAAAWDALHGEPPDVLVADVMMPKLDGLELVRRIRRDPELQSLPVVLLSARAGEESRVEGFAAGADDYVVKPFGPAELLARVEKQALRGQLQETQSALHRSLSAVFTHAPVGIAVLRGPEHRFEYANPAYTRLVPDVPLVGRTVRECFPELERQGIIDVLDSVFATGEPYIGRGWRLVFKDPLTAREHEHFYDFAYQPLPGRDGTSGIAVVVFEVSELMAAKRAAEAANRTKDEFMAILGHELRNPLAPIQTALHLMRMRLGDAALNEREIIERQVQHMVRLIDDLLDVARLTRGNLELKMTPVETWNIVSKAVEMASPLIEQRRHTLSVQVPGSGLKLFGDPVRLSQIVANLLTNAAKYTEPGGRIEVTAREEDADVVLAVHDTGIGIDPQHLDTIFEMFAQGAQSPDRPSGGLGLGLTICRNLAQLHGGSVAAQSEGKGKGSTFMLRLPCCSDAAAREVPRVPEFAAPSGPPGRILVVDDNADAALSLTSVLQAWGHTTAIAHDGPSALRMLEQFPADVALLDIGLPVMDGFQLAQQIRGDERLRGLRLIALTGYGEEKDRLKSQSVGFDAYAVKPVELDRLAALLHEQLDSARAH